MLLSAKSGHTRLQAHYLATACDLAYLNSKLAKDAFSDQLGLTGTLVSVDNTQAFVGENDDAIVIAFRGSQSPTSLDGVKDWLLTNARNFLVVPEGRLGTDFAAAGVGARFHRGFMQALEEIWPLLFSRVDEAFGKRERPVWVTGHSLGGALALLCAWRMHRQFVSIEQVVTFGAPMIGNHLAAEAFQREFPNRIFRYVDVGDLVPRLPMVSLLSNDYDHCQQEIVVGTNTIEAAADTIATVAKSSIDGAITSGVVDAMWGEISKGMPSHLMNNYIDRLT